MNASYVQDQNQPSLVAIVRENQVRHLVVFCSGQPVFEGFLGNVYILKWSACAIYVLLYSFNSKAPFFLLSGKVSCHLTSVCSKLDLTLVRWNDTPPDIIKVGPNLIMRAVCNVKACEISVARKFKSICRKLALFEFALPSSTCKLASWVCLKSDFFYSSLCIR